MNLHSFMLLTLSLSPLLDATAVARQWVSRDGNFKVQAELVGFDGFVVEIQKADGNRAKVPIDRLSVADREYIWTQIDDPQIAPGVPPALRTFKQAVDLSRPVEIRRIEKRLEALRKELRSGSRDVNHPVGQQAKTLAKHLGKRLVLLKSGAAFTPTLSPKDFRVGQIGTLDNDLQFTIRSKPEGDERKISISFYEHRHINELPGARNNWHTTTISRPDLMILKADFVNQLPETHLDRNRRSPTNRLLRARVYQIVESRPRGAAKDYVLTPFAMGDVEPLLMGKRPAANVAKPDNSKDSEEGDPGLPDLVIADVQAQPKRGTKIPYTYTVKNMGKKTFSASVTWQAYYSKDRVYDKSIDRPAHGFIASLGKLAPGESVSKDWGFYRGPRDANRRYLIFVVDAKNKIRELSEDNNTYVFDTWEGQQDE
ncbi:SHD1 domain-containing protein [Stieleria sp. ICT_E10.1]|uniref:CARDB domain-containing protein n=1 Tax=Stieleria sedimenti TaxID=2976331 RepID=UPI00217FFF9B|nr:CARDB domain-containing protein [Stieleria sedimenti]MCS7466929.1 SHD1 domain-containing protein [Stieleria sedimenti]